MTMTVAKIGYKSYTRNKQLSVIRYIAFFLSPEDTASTIAIQGRTETFGCFVKLKRFYNELHLDKCRLLRQEA